MGTLLGDAVYLFGERLNCKFRKIPTNSGSQITLEQGVAGIYPNTVCDILPMKVLGLVVAGSWEAPVTSESVSGQCLGLRRSRFHLAVGSSQCLCATEADHRGPSVEIQMESFIICRHQCRLVRLSL